MANLNKNQVYLDDIVFVNMNNVISLDDFIGKIEGSVRRKGRREIITVKVRKANGDAHSAFINRCSHANETQRKEYFKDCLRYG